MNKKQLSILLSKLSNFEKQDVKLEQYPTDSNIAAEVLWDAYLKEDIKDKLIADLGCGQGILGLGALILGAKKVIFVDIDKNALEVAKKNKAFIESELNQKYNAMFLHENVQNFKRKVNVILQNPPFGVQKNHMDKLFLLKSMELAPVIYTFHKISTEKFVRKITLDYGYKIKQKYAFKFPLKKTFWFHMKSIHYIDVGCWRLVKI
ncbi:MAG: METTL5 family protein [Nanoarchaeota archaeon]|nr:METTL5 family protein [Nanoarchaeota archaeon]